MWNLNKRWSWLVILLMSSIVVAATHQSQADEDEEYYKLMQVFADTFEQIDDNYVTSVEKRQLIEAAIRGMLTKLDPYSNYISPEQLSRFDQSVNQEFGGIGIQVNYDPVRKHIVVVSPMPGTPAYKAGVLASDRISEIDGKPVSEFPKGAEIEEAVLLLKGKPGAKVTIGVVRANVEEVLKIDVERAIIKVATVLGDHYNDDGTWDYMINPKKKIGYIRLTNFSRNSTKEMLAALNQLKDQGMKGLIFDLRYNPGGLLTAAADISDMFIDSGKIVSTKGRRTKERVWRAHERGTFPHFPMVILVNNYSASASEIVSACLQDHKRAVVIGERTWGKGSVQNVIQLEGGASALKLTTASYHRPSGKNIHRFPGAKKEDEWGVMPNDGYIVKMNAAQMREYNKFRRDRDILKAGGPPKSDYVDPQMQKALDTIHELLAKDNSPNKDKGEGTPPVPKKPVLQNQKAKAVDKKSSVSLPHFFVTPRRDFG